MQQHHKKSWKLWWRIYLAKNAIQIFNTGHYIQKIYVLYKHDEIWGIVQLLNKVIYNRIDNGHKTDIFVSNEDQVLNKVFVTQKPKFLKLFSHFENYLLLFQSKSFNCLIA